MLDVGIKLTYSLQSEIVTPRPSPADSCAFCHLYDGLYSSHAPCALPLLPAAVHVPMVYLPYQTSTPEKCNGKPGV